MLTITVVLVVLAAAVAVVCTFMEAETAPEVLGATLSMTYVDVEVSVSGPGLDRLLDIYNSRQATETSQPMPEAGRLTVELETESGVEIWTVTPGGICSESGHQGNYTWDKADYDALADLFWNQVKPDHGRVTNPTSSLSPPALTADQTQKFIGLFRSMVLTPTSNEPDFINELRPGLTVGNQLLFSFL